MGTSDAFSSFEICDLSSNVVIMALVEDRIVDIGGKLEALPDSGSGDGLDTLDSHTDRVVSRDSELYLQDEEGHEIKYKTLTWKKVCRESIIS